MENNSHLRSIVKGVTWRIIAITDTFIVVAIVLCIYDNCNFSIAIKVGIFELLLKTFLYYFHERLWINLNNKIKIRKKLLIKTLSWRLIATLITFILVGSLTTYGLSFITILIVVIEVITKSFLYYFHDYFWDYKLTKRATSGQ